MNSKAGQLTSPLFFFLFHQEEMRSRTHFTQQNVFLPDAVDLAVKGDFFAMGVGDNPLTTGLVADGETILIQLGEGEKIGDSIVAIGGRGFGTSLFWWQDLCRHCNPRGG